MIPEEYLVDEKEDIIRLIDVCVINENIKIVFFKGNQLEGNFVKTEMEDMLRIEDICDVEKKQYEFLEYILEQQFDVSKEPETYKKRKKELDVIAKNLIKESMEELKEELPKLEYLESLRDTVEQTFKVIEKLKKRLFLEYNSIMKEYINERLENIDSEIKKEKERAEHVRNLEIKGISYEIIKNIEETISKFDYKEVLEKEKIYNNICKNYLIIAVLKEINSYMEKVFKKQDSLNLEEEIIIMNQYIYLFLMLIKKDIYLSNIKRDNMLKEVILKNKIFTILLKENLSFEKRKLLNE